MVLPYNEKIVNFAGMHPNFIGFINPTGTLISFESDDAIYGNGHGEENMITLAYANNLLYDFWKPDGFRWEYADDIKESYIRNLQKRWQNGWEEYCSLAQDGDAYSDEELARLKLIMRINEFFLKCIQPNDIYGLYPGKKDFMTREEFYNLYAQNFAKKAEWYPEFAYDYLYVEKSILADFKDIAVRYLNHDSVETNKSKTICTSSQTPNERFYNYKLMEWDIQVLPRMLYDDSINRFRSLCSYQTDKETILGEEIKSIVRSIPIEQRYQYFRK